MSSKLDFLIDHGIELNNLLRKSKTRPVEADQDIPGEVQKIVASLVSFFQNAPSNSGFATESLENLWNKMEVILEEFIEHDSDGTSKYKEFKDDIKKVRELESQKKVTSPTSVETFNETPNVRPENDGLEEAQFDAAFQKLTVDDQERLRCFLLFPGGVEIKKREIIHCWIGMGLLDSSTGERLLAKLVATGLIDRKIQNKKLLNRYMMSEGVRSKILCQDTNTLPLIENEGSWSLLRSKEQPIGNNVASKITILRRGSLSRANLPVDKFDPEALLNINQGALNATRFKTMSGMHKLKVVHLGCWHQDSTKYIVVEDVEAIKNLKNLSEVAFLSLEGVSGMVKLPECVYELRKLKVLDLRACNNLEQLPDGIEYLKRLTHLDLSGCYLLDHVPKGIALLVNLKVLKGYIVNSTQHLESETKAKGKRKGNRTPGSSPCLFAELAKLKQLGKLTIITRRMNFPTPVDFKTFSQMDQLTRLRISWVAGSVTEGSTYYVDDKETFPATLTKLELQAAPEHIASRLLQLMSADTTNCGLEKLYIRGGGLRKLNNLVVQPKVVRLRYLPNLQIAWDDFIKLFPSLNRVEILGCPNLIAFPCDDNGVWELDH